MQRGITGPILPRMAIPPSDPWLRRLERFVYHGDEQAELLGEMHNLITRKSRRYPACWFVLGRKDDVAVLDLSNRVFSTCSRQKRARKPFLNRRPFLACVVERFDGAQIRGHLVWWRSSITMEHMRRDYEANIARDPQLRWEANLYRDIGAYLRANAQSIGGSPTRWRAPGLRSAVRMDPDTLVAELSRGGRESTGALVQEALLRVPYITQTELAAVLARVLNSPLGEREPTPDEVLWALRDEVREAVKAVWTRLTEEERSLLRAISDGQTYEEILAVHPEYADATALGRVVRALDERFVRSLERTLGMAANRSARWREIALFIAEVIAQLEEEI